MGGGKDLISDRMRYCGLGPVDNGREVQGERVRDRVATNKIKIQKA